MQAIYQKIPQLIAQGEVGAYCTVVDTSGSTPQKPGAKLLVRNDGSGVGTLGGGCVEGDIWFAAKELMKRKGTTQFRSYELNEDIAAQDGLVCGGTMYFLIDPVYTPEGYLPYVQEIENAYTGGQSVAVATLIKPLGDSDNALGTKLLIRQDGTTDGSLGLSSLDDEAISKAKSVMLHGMNEFVKSKDGTEYFIEGYTTPPQLILCGAGHVSKAISNQEKSLGFRIFSRKLFQLNKILFPKHFLFPSLG